MKVVVAKKELKEVRPRYRYKYCEAGAVETIRTTNVADKKRRDKAYIQAFHKSNNYIFRGKNISDNKPVPQKMRTYLGPNDNIIKNGRVAYLDPRNPLSEIPTNLISTDALKYQCDENDGIK